MWNRRSSHPEPQGEMPEPDVIQQAREAGDMAGTAVIKMLRAYDALASRLREAEDINNKLRDDVEYLTREIAMQKRLAEAAERGKEGMVMVPREFFDWSGNEPRYITANGIPMRMPRKQAKMLSAAEEKK